MCDRIHARQVKEIREIFDGTIILSGAMSRGGDIVATQAMGADLAYMGTRFIATREANAPLAGLRIAGLGGENPIDETATEV